MGDRHEIDAEDMDLPAGKVRPSRFLTLDEEKDIAEARAIRRALARHAGRITECATELGVSRATLYRLLKKHR
jgi:two-component system NtrC family response regulator